MSYRCNKCQYVGATTIKSKWSMIVTVILLLLLLPIWILYIIINLFTAKRVCKNCGSEWVYKEQLPPLK